MNLWPHSSAIAALPKPGETWVPSAEVGKSGYRYTQPLPYSVGGGWAHEGGETLLCAFLIHQVAAQPSGFLACVFCAAKGM